MLHGSSGHAFSNGTGWRSLATIRQTSATSRLKLIHVQRAISSWMDDSLETQDFIDGQHADSALVPTRANSWIFRKFHRSTDNLLHAIPIAIHNPTSRATLLGSLTSVATRTLNHRLQFWMGTPYRLGYKQAAKFSVRPEKCIDDDEHLELRPAGQ